MTLQPYSEFRPTGLDCAGAFLSDRQDWLVSTVTQTRDSDCLERSNFAEAWKRISAKDTGEDCEVHRFGHWGPGWFEIIISRPGSACADEASEIESQLENYSILNEDAFSVLEMEEACQWWESMSVRARVDAIRESGSSVSLFVTRRSELPQDEDGRLFEYLTSR